MEKSITFGNDVRERDIGFIKGIALSAAGLMLSLTRLFGYPAPFAAAGLCALNGFECVFAFVGAAAGYTINGGLSVCIPYIAAMGILTLIRLASGAFFPKTASPLLRIIQSAAAGLCVFGANVFTAKGVYDIFIAFAFGAVSSVFAFCLQRLRTAGLRSVLSEQKPVISAAVCILFVLLTAAVTSIDIGVINLGVFLASLCVLWASEIKAESSTAVCAVLSAAGIAAGREGFAASCIMISVTAPVIMLLDKYGRITRACAFIFTVGGGLMITGMTADGGIAAMSATAAAAVYMAVPEKYSPFSGIISRAEIAAASRPYAAFGRKLGNMGEAVDEMRSAVIRTAEALENENIRDISWVYNKAADSVCRNCASNMKCWGAHYNETADIMNKAVGMLKDGSFVSENMLGGHLLTDCNKRGELAAALNKQYTVYLSAESSSRKIAEMRNVLTSQLGATETMLRRMSEELERNDTYDDTAASAAEKVLTELGLVKPAVIAVIIGDRLSIDAYCTGELQAGAEELADRLSFALHRELDLPMISECGDKLHITISERARFDAQIKVFGKSKSGNRKSGDCTECFSDGSGHIYMMLSDGMGTGSRARIDSAFTCGMLSKLLKAGIDFDAAAEMINTSLLVKSSDESFATLDLCKIDLNTGDITLCKAGGASTFVRCGNSFAEISQGGLPLGTSHGADISGKVFRLTEGDIVIMTSDGAELDKGWLEQLVMRDKHADLDRIIDTVGEALRLSSDKETEDDMTVIGVKLTR